MGFGNLVSTRTPTEQIEPAAPSARICDFQSIRIQGQPLVSLVVKKDWDLAATEVVFEANDRCNQENLIEQLKNGVRALHAPVNTLDANWAYMVMVSLAWTIKAWMALLLPVTPRWRKQHEAERDAWLRMEYRTFLAAVINVPAQVIQKGRRLVVRLLAWRPQLPVFFRLLDGL